MSKTNKYGAVPTEVDGRRFASKKEAARYGELCLMERAGEIQNLECQKRFHLDVNGVHICDYIADFVYQDVTGLVVEDTKGFVTPVYALKKKLMWACHGIAIVEPGRRTEPRSRRIEYPQTSSVRVLREARGARGAKA